MKKFFIIINLIVAFVLCTGLTINGGISYNVNSARKISFDNIQNKIDTKEYSLYFYDKNYKSNIKAKYKNKNKFINRYVTFFSDGCYGIIYKRDKNTGYYYSAKGILEYIEIKSLLIVSYSLVMFLIYDKITGDKPSRLITYSFLFLLYFTLLSSAKSCISL